MRNLNQDKWISSVPRVIFKPAYIDIFISREYFQGLWRSNILVFRNIIKYNNIDLTIKKNFSNL